MDHADPRPMALEAVDAALHEGQDLQALERLAALHARAPGDPAVFARAVTALLALARGASGPDILARDGVADLLRAMILQEPSPDRPRSLHQALSGLVPQQDGALARPVLAMIMPVIDELLKDRAKAPGVALLLAIGRSVMPRGAPSQRTISRLHLEGFPAFSPADFALPYSVVIQRKYYAANVADLRARYPDPAAALDPAAGLSLCHLRLLDQLGLHPLFDPGEDDALADAIAVRLEGAACRAEDRGAARALVMRYLRRADGPAAQRLRALGLDRQVIEAASRWQRADSGFRPPAPALDRPAARYLAAGLNTLRLVAPALAPHRRKPRVALCVSGQLRGYERAFETWKRALLPFAEFDIHVHSWKNVGRSDPKPNRGTLPFEGRAFCAEWRRICRQEGLASMRRRQPHLFVALDNDTVTDEAHVQGVYNARSVVVEDETETRFDGFSNQDKMLYKINGASELARTSGRDYDLEMRLRPDIALTLPAFFWSGVRKTCAARPLVLVDIGFGINYRALFMGDQMALGAPESMWFYTSTWCRYGALGELDLPGVPSKLTGHVSLSQTCWYSGLELQSLPYARSGLMDMRPLRKPAVLQALQADAADRNDAIDHALLSAIRQDIGGAR